MLELTTYKNYKELVKALGWEEKKSNNRAGQMKQLDAMCKYHKEGQKFVIEEIYDKPLPVVDGRQEDYIPLIENLILNLCYGETFQIGFDGYIRVSMGRIARAVGLFNENFAQCRRMVKKTSKYLDTNVNTTKEYFDNVKRSACGKIETALKNLDKKATVSWTKITMIAEVKELDDYSTIENNGEEKVVKNTVESHRKATDEELDFIRDTRKEVYIRYNVKDAKQAKFSPKAKQISRDIKKDLLKKNISYYYEAYEIRFNPKYVEYDLQQFNLSYEEKEAMRQTLKEVFSIKIYENADKRNVKGLGRPNSSDKKGFRWGEKYMEDYKKLNDTMIVNDNNVVKDVYKMIPDKDIEEWIGEVGIDRISELVEKMKKNK